jgi:hypothetical protein
VPSGSHPMSVHLLLATRALIARQAVQRPRSTVGETSASTVQRGRAFGLAHAHARGEGGAAENLLWINGAVIPSPSC